MKEKIKNIFKNKYFKIISFTLVWLFILSESYNIYIDMYNFKELEKAKPILESIPKNAKKFHTLKEFNETYNANIKPIKNCYYVSNDNGKYPYIYWFKLESLVLRLVYWWNAWFDYLYPDPSVFTFSCSFWCVLVSRFESQKERLLHFWRNYVYPDYDLGLEQTCMGPVCPYNYMIFDWTMSNTCRDY